MRLFFSDYFFVLVFASLMTFFVAIRQISYETKPTFLPASMLTADASRLNLDLTKQAADAQLSQLYLQGTQVQFQMTQAVQASINSTGTAAIVSVNSTATVNQQNWEASVRVNSLHT